MSSFPYLPLYSYTAWPKKAANLVRLSNTNTDKASIPKAVFNFLIPKIAWTIVAICTAIVLALGFIYNKTASLTIFLLNHTLIILEGLSKPLKEKVFPPFIDFHGLLPNEVLENNMTWPVPMLSQTTSSHVLAPDLPAIFPKRRKHIGHHPTILDIPSPLTGGKPNTRGTNTNITHFFQEKATLPGTRKITFWSIFHVAGTDAGYTSFEDFPHIVPTLFPSLTPCKQVPTDTPSLSLNLLMLIQTNSEIASKYLLGFLTILQAWGISLSARKKLQKADNFVQRAKYISKNPSIHWHMQQVLKSLGVCGFKPLAQQLLDFLKNNQAAYQLSSEFLSPHTTEESGKLSQALSSLGQAYGANQRTNASFYLAYWDKHKTYLASDANTPLRHEQKPPQQWVSCSFQEGVEGDIFSYVDKNQTPLIVWNVEQKRWCLPYLLAPQYFYTLQEQEKKRN